MIQIKSKIEELSVKRTEKQKEIHKLYSEINRLSKDLDVINEKIRRLTIIRTKDGNL